jgi:hypothetical protein
VKDEEKLIFPFGRSDTSYALWKPVNEYSNRDNQEIERENEGKAEMK